MVISEEQYTYLSGKGPIERVGTRWTFQCDNPHCGKIFTRKGTKATRTRSYHYCCHPCSTKHFVGVCEIDDCNTPTRTQKHRRGAYPNLCPKHKKRIQRKARVKRNRARMFKLMGNACVCCGERDPLFFQIDHIHNDADYSGLNSNNAGSIQLHQYLAEPERYQLLCANCNHAKRMNNGELYRPTSWTRRKSALVE